MPLLLYPVLTDKQGKSILIKKKKVTFRVPLCDVFEFSTTSTSSSAVESLELTAAQINRPRSDANEPLTLEQSHRYQQIVGALNYIAHATRIDIAFAVNQLSRATHFAKMRPFNGC